MPNKLFFTVMEGTHRFVQWITFGRVGWKLQQMPVIELTTIGRRSGKTRSTMLTSPLQVEDAYVVVASRGGDDRHPAWFLNLRDNPNVQVIIEGGQRTPMLARVADAGERASLWPIIAKQHPNYAGYQRKTRRQIPLVLIEPRPT